MQPSHYSYAHARAGTRMHACMHMQRSLTPPSCTFHVPIQYARPCTAAASVGAGPPPDPSAPLRVARVPLGLAHGLRGASAAGAGHAAPADEGAAARAAQVEKLCAFRAPTLYAPTLYNPTRSTAPEHAVAVALVLVPFGTFERCGYRRCAIAYASQLQGCGTWCQCLPYRSTRLQQWAVCDGSGLPLDCSAQL